MNQSLSDNQKNRKNSMPYYNIQQFQPNQSLSNSSSNKSLSYPSFGTPPQQQQQQNATNMSNFQRSASREKLNQFTLMQQQHHIQFNQQSQIPQPNNNAYHRNSLNSLMPFPIQQQQQQQFPNRRNSCGVNSSMSSPLIDSSSNSDQGKSISPNMQSMMPKSAMMDINSRLESLCRQMTEQAIN